MPSSNHISLFSVLNPQNHLLFIISTRPSKVFEIIKTEISYLIILYNINMRQIVGNTQFSVIAAACYLPDTWFLGVFVLRITIWRNKASNITSGKYGPKYHFITWYHLTFLIFWKAHINEFILTFLPRIRRPVNNWKMETLGIRMLDDVTLWINVLGLR